MITIRDERSFESSIESNTVEEYVRELASPPGACVFKTCLCRYQTSPVPSRAFP